MSQTSLNSSRFILLAPSFLGLWTGTKSPPSSSLCAQIISLCTGHSQEIYTFSDGVLVSPLPLPSTPPPPCCCVFRKCKPNIEITRTKQKRRPAL